MLNISPGKVGESIKKQYKIHSLDTLPTPRTGRLLARWMTGIGIIAFFCLFLPWQQNITGTGKMTALRPADRPQTVETAIPGRIVEWRVAEGQFVHQGDTLLVLAEVKDDYFDPNYLLRLKEQLEAKANSITATQDQIAATERQLTNLRQGLQLSLSKARNKVRQATFKVTSDSIDWANEKIQFEISTKQFDRFKELYEKKGLISLTELENRRRKFQENQAKLISTENKYYVSRNELTNARIELNSIQADYGDKISKAEAELGAKKSYLAEAQSEQSKLRNKYANVKVRLDNYYMLAPQDGFVVKALKAGLGETIKEGEAVVTIQPDNPHLAAEVYVRAMDVPLISIGRKVRLEFDGWPALQFSGWPSVAVGTFGGRVAVIDYVNSADGTYRILVTPDPEEEPWPAQLRQGSGVYGWCMLDTVPVWYELWRQLNGFPPSLNKAPEDDKEKAKAAKK